MGLSEYIVMRELNHPDINNFARYQQLGGWAAYANALKTQTP